MAGKRKERKNTGLFDVPDRCPDVDNSGSDHRVGVFGGPTHDGRLLGGPGDYTGLFDTPDRVPGDMPGLFDRPGRAPGNESGLFTKPRDGRRKSVGLFDKPRRGDRA